MGDLELEPLPGTGHPASAIVHFEVTLERSLDGGEVLVLNRNNGHDRLEPMTELPPDSPLRSQLQTASPNSCLTAVE